MTQISFKYKSKLAKVMQSNGSKRSYFPLFCVHTGITYWIGFGFFFRLTFKRAWFFHREWNTKNWIIRNQLEFGSCLNQTIGTFCIFDSCHKTVLNYSIDYWVYLFDAFNISQDDLLGCHLYDERKFHKIIEIFNLKHKTISIWV